MEKPLVHTTEMVAFFDRVGHVRMHKVTPSARDGGEEIEERNTYIKNAFGIVHVRTDGECVLVASHGGKPGQKESYAFRVDEHGDLTFEEKIRVG